MSSILTHDSNMAANLGTRKSWTDEQMSKAVAQALSIASTLRLLNMSQTGANYITVKDAINRLSLNTSHWTGIHHRKGKALINPKKSLSELLTENSRTQTSRLKHRLIKEGLFTNQCSVCCQEPSWKDKPLVMVLDHINGINNDFRFENLRLLCPNCNSQQSTFAGRNNKSKRGPGHFCNNCNRKLTALRKSGMCNVCNNKSRSKSSQGDGMADMVAPNTTAARREGSTPSLGT